MEIGGYVIVLFILVICSISNSNSNPYTMSGFEQRDIQFNENKFRNKSWHSLDGIPSAGILSVSNQEIPTDEGQLYYNPVDTNYSGSEYGKVPNINSKEIKYNSQALPFMTFTESAKQTTAIKKQIKKENFYNKNNETNREYRMLNARDNIKILRENKQLGESIGRISGLKATLKDSTGLYPKNIPTKPPFQRWNAADYPIVTANDLNLSDMFPQKANVVRMDIDILRENIKKEQETLPLS
jgi:hypothetical protein